jgi:hypothetical protein
VIYTDEYSSKFINTQGKTNIKIVLKPLEQFHNYKYKDNWIKNHAKNDLLNKRIEWQVNMLWSEKAWFVQETVAKSYFDTEYSDVVHDSNIAKFYCSGCIASQASQATKSVNISITGVSNCT